MRWKVIAAGALLCLAGTVHARSLRGSVYLTPLAESSFTSVGEAEFLDDLNYRDPDVSLSGEHAVSGGQQMFTHQVSGAGYYSYELQGPTQPGTCYSTSLHVVADPWGLSYFEETWQGHESKCTPPPSGGTIEVVGDKCDGLNGYGQPCSPIVVNLEDGPWTLSGPDDPVSFDIDADASMNRITWTGREEPLAFLALDRNANGVIDDGAELFGTATRLRSGERAPNGFDALRELDANGDGRIDRTDPVWRMLLLWADADHDGVSQPGELQSLAHSEIAALHTAYREIDRKDPQRNLFRYMSVLRTERGQRPYYDVFFVAVR